MDTCADSLLLEKLKRGDADGISQLYTRYHARVLRYCMSLLSDAEQSKDVAQNVFLKLHTCRDTIRSGDALRSWLFTVARNEAFTALGKRRAVELTEMVLWEGEAPDDELISKERTELIDAALSRLSIPYRDVLMLRVYEQLSYGEIAAITGATVSSVKSRLFKARKALVQLLHPYLHT